MARCFRYLQNFRYIIVELTIFSRFRFKFRMQHAYLACVAPATQANAVFIRLSALGLLKVLDLDSGSRESGGRL